MNWMISPLKKIRAKRGDRGLVINTISSILNQFFCFTSLISPTLNTKLRYLYVYGKTINLKKPQNFIEKCNYYKLNYVIKEELYRKCSDKYLVREYVEQCGCGEYLNKLLYKYENISDIEWHKLPNEFALKINDGAGYYIICDNKDLLNINEAIGKLKKWWYEYNYLLYSELQNKADKRMIIVEKYIRGENGAKQPTDYKFYCFSGVPRAILVIWNRDKCEEPEKVFMSLEWEYISHAFKAGDEVKCDVIPKKPKDLDTMIEIAKKLSHPFNFVRVDLYQGEDKPIFGELTFTCAGAMFTSQTDPKVLDMSELFNISKV